jgi:DinB superfamily
MLERSLSYNLERTFLLEEVSMNKQIAMAILMLAMGTAGATVSANAQAATQAKPDQKPTFAMVIDRNLSNVEKEVVGAADAMPEDKFNFAPTQGEFKGVRTFAVEVKHIAVANYALGAGILGEKPPVDLKGENGPDNITSKADVMKFLKDSFTYAHKAANSIDETNVLGLVQSPFGPNKVTRLGLAIGMVSHPQDHYGQMVEYLRMNNIIPPASRGQ